MAGGLMSGVRVWGPRIRLGDGLGDAWVVAIDEVAKATGRTAEQVIDQYETEIIAARESAPPDTDEP